MAQAKQQSWEWPLLRSIVVESAGIGERERERELRVGGELPNELEGAGPL